MRSEPKRDQLPSRRMVVQYECTVCADYGSHFLFFSFQLKTKAQVDSEDNIRTILAKVRDENKTPGLIRQLDSELGQEVKSAPGTGSHTSD
jgi:hypothetical protein